MKKLLIFLIAILLSVPLMSQNEFKYVVYHYGGIRIGPEARISFMAQIDSAKIESLQLVYYIGGVAYPSNATHTGDVTGATALTIANGAVDLSMFSATGTASSSTYLRGDNTWASPAGSGDMSYTDTATMLAPYPSFIEMRGEIGDSIQDLLDNGEPVVALADAGNFADYTIEQVGDSVWAIPGVNKTYTAYRGVNLSPVLTSAMGQLTNGGLIQIGAGTYDDLSTIVIPYDSIIIQGAGSRLTKLIIQDANDAGTLAGHCFFVNGKDNISFINLDIDGNKLNQNNLDTRTGVPQASAAGIYGYDTVAYGYTNDLLVDDCYIHDFTMEGVIVANGNDPVIRNCTFQYNGWSAFEFYGGVERGIFDNNKILNNAMGTTLSGNCRISNCYAYNPWNENHWATAGTNNVFTIEHAASDPSPKDVVIENCIMDGDSIYRGIWGILGTMNLRVNNVTIRGSVLTQANAIDLGNDTMSYISNCYVSDWTGTGAIGISASGAYHSVYSDNTFKDVKYAGIWLKDVSTYNVVEGNYIYNPDNNGIGMPSGNNYNTIINNYIIAWTPISDAGSDNVQSNNLTGQSRTTASMGSPLQIEAQTGTTYTLRLRDKDKLVTLNNGSAIALTVPTNTTAAFPIGTKINLACLGAGTVTVGGAGITWAGSITTLDIPTGKGATIIKLATDTWWIIGGIE